MKTSQNGINIIKQFEGCRLKAYKPVSTEKYWTIGYGHYGADVKADMTITQAQADKFLVNDLKKFEDAVNGLGLTLNQNQFDALVSFAYNCGTGNLKKLVAGRTLAQIGDALLLYNKASGKELAGLTKRRKVERELFMGKVTGEKYTNPGGADLQIKVRLKMLKVGHKGNQVKALQTMLWAIGYKQAIDGIYGPATAKNVADFQQKNQLINDGITGENTWTMLLYKFANFR